MVMLLPLKISTFLNYKALNKRQFDHSYILVESIIHYLHQRILSHYHIHEYEFQKYKVQIIDLWEKRL